MRYRHAKKSSNRSVYISRLIIFPLVIFLIIVLLNRSSDFLTIQGNGKEYYYQKSISPPDAENQYDVIYYDLNLEVRFSPDLKNNEITGFNRIFFVSRKSPLRKIVLNFNSAMSVDSISGMGLSYLHKDGLLYVELNRELKQNEKGVVTVYFSGWPKPYHPWLGGWNFTTRLRDSDFEEIPWVATMNPPFGAQTWFPSKDIPSDKADSVTIRITVPDSLQAISNGVLIKKVPLSGNRVQYVWKEKYPIATYLMAVNISQYKEYVWEYSHPQFPSFPVYFYGFEEDTAVFDTIRAQLESMLDYYQSLLGAYPFNEEKYAMIKYNTTGGMENQTITSVQGFQPDRRNLYAHELAHQWAGDLVTNASFSESFLNEALATYLTALYIRSVDGEKAFKTFLEKFRHPDAGPIRVKKILIPDSVYHTQRVYHKGALFFNMLRDVVGDSCFTKTLRKYFRQFAYRSVRAKDLQQLFEKDCEKDLKLFFDSWLNNSGAPQLKIQLKNKKRQSEQSLFRYELKIEQQQEGNPFYLKMPVLLKSAQRDSLIRLEMKKKKLKLEIKSSFAIDSVIVDPFQDWLLFAEFQKTGN